MKGCLLPEYQDDFVGTEEVKPDCLSRRDPGLILVDKLPISSSIVKAPSEHTISICLSPCGVASTNLDEFNSKKRAFTPQNWQASFQKNKDDVEPKLGNMTGLETVGLVEFTNGKGLKMSLPSDSLSFSSSRSIWTLSELFQKDQCYRGALEDSLRSNQESDPKKLDTLERCDLINNSSSIDDEFVEVSQMQAWVNRSSQNSHKSVQEHASLSIRKLEKLPKEDKDEVDKFLKGFSQAPCEWISDAEESSYSEDSLFDEDKVLSMPSTDRCMKERDLKVNYEQKSSIDYFSSKIKNANIHMEKKLLCDSNIFCTDKRVDTASKGGYLTENTDWQTHSNSRNNDTSLYAKNSKGWLDSDDVQAAFHVKELQNYSAEHIAVHANKSTLEIVGNADDATRCDLLVDAVHKVGGGVLACSHSVLDQDQETISYVPTVDGLVLELCKASTLQKGNHRKESSDELVIQKLDDFNQSTPENFQNLLTLQSQLTLDSEPDGKESSLDKRLSMEGQMQYGTSASLRSPKVDEEHQVQMMGSMDFSDGTLEILHVIGEDSRSTDLAPIPFSGPISQSALIPFSGSISLRSDSSNNSAHSFAFPVLTTEWTSSPVKMAPADHRYLRKKQGCRFCCFGCTKPSTIF